MRDHTEILVGRGAATHSTFDVIDELQQDYPQGASILSFQLPFPLHLETERFAVPAQRKGTTIYFRFERIYAAVDEKCVMRVYDSTTWNKSGLPEQTRIFECTQCVALMPLWGTRMRYYLRYLDFVRTGRMNGIVLPSEINPYHRHMPGSVNAYMFEADMAARALPEVHFSIRNFLKQYIITSLDEVVLPDKLFSVFASTAPGRIFSFGDAPSLLFGLLGERKSSPIRTATAVDIQNASLGLHATFRALSFSFSRLRG